MSRSQRYRKAEALMYRYKENCMTLSTLEGLLLERLNHGDISVQQYGDQTYSNGNVSDKVQDYVNELIQMEDALEKLRADIGVVDRLLIYLTSESNELKKGGLAILRGRYFQLRDDVYKKMPESVERDIRHWLVSACMSMI